MKFHPPTNSPWQLFVLVVLSSLWLGLSGLLIVAHGDLEAFLHETYGPNSGRDAFHDLNRVAVLFWVVHSSLTITAVAASRHRRSDVIAVLLVGPVIGLAISLLGQRWGDPNWAVFVGVCLIGWIVGTIVGGMYWFVKSK